MTPASHERVLDELEKLLTRGKLLGRGARTIVGGAKKQATELIAATGHEPADVQIAVLSFVAEVVRTIALERRWARDELDVLIERCAELVGLSQPATRYGIHLRASHDPTLLQLPPMLALDAQLRIAYELGPAEGLSVWLHGVGRVPNRVVSVGAGQSGRAALAAVGRALDGDDPLARARLRARVIRCWETTAGALLVRARPADHAFMDAVGRTLVVALGAILDKDAALHRTDGGSSAIAAAAERRLTRFVLDLHDGVLQDAAVLSEQVRYVRRQVERALADDERLPRLLEDIDEIGAAAVVLDGGLREAIRSLDADVVARRPLRESLEREAAAARSRGLDVSLTVAGKLDALTDSQRIAIVRIVQEAIGNVVRHGDAASARVTVSAAREGVRVEVRDDGRGFDVESTLVKAARRGRLGLLGMDERVRLLGGRFEIESRVGGPTTVVAVLPAWKPVDVPSIAGVDERRAARS